MDRRLLAPVLALVLGGCASSGGLKPFVSDGCSLSPDRSLSGRTDWCHCCLAHDLVYWRGGTAAERRAADDELKRCVREETGDQAWSANMRSAVRVFGHPRLPTWFRWGYGWPYPRPYGPLTAEERARADALEAEYREDPPTFCPAGTAKAPDG